MDVDEIENLTGRVLDARVAEHVMGWVRITMTEQMLNPGFFDGGPLYKPAGEVEFLVPPGRDTSDGVGVRAIIDDLRIGGDLPFFSKFPGDARRVMNEISDRDTGWRLVTPHGEMWNYIASIIQPGYREFQTQKVQASSSDSLEEAICRAALEWVIDRE